MREPLAYFTLDNPIFHREMHTRWRGGRLWVLPAIVVGGTVLLIAVVGMFGFYERRFWLEQYPVIACVMGYVIAALVPLLVTPALTAGALAGERQQRTLEMLMITRLSSWQIILGKLAASLLPIGLTVAPCLCLSSFSALIGSAVGPIRDYWGYWTQSCLQWLTAPLSAILAACAGMFFSAVCRNVASATALSYVVTLGTYLLSRWGIWLLAALGIVGVDPRPHTGAGMVGREAIVWIVFAWLAAAGLFGARWRLEREAEMR